MKWIEVIVMSKLAPTSIKYLVKAKITAKGVIEKPDVIGAIFGQTEGLLGDELDLRDLQRTGRIGRIEVDIESKGGNSEGEIIIPSSLDASETALIAATIETIERVGPCSAEIQLLSVEDTRADKRKYVVDKAKEILRGLSSSEGLSALEVSDEIKEAVRTEEITSYQGLPAGPSLTESDEIIIVEGRADIINLLKHGIKNTIAIEGTSIPPAIADLAKEKNSTLFVDGDRGGRLISKEMSQLAEIDYIAQAPEGKEVEELGKKETFKALREKMPPEKFFQERPERYPRGYRERKPRQKRQAAPKAEAREKKPVRLKPKMKELFVKTLDELVGTRAAYIFDKDMNLLGKVPVSELANSLDHMENTNIVVFDGKVDMRLNMAAKKNGVEYLVGMDKESFSSPIKIISRHDLE